MEPPSNKQGSIYPSAEKPRNTVALWLHYLVVVDYGSARLKKIPFKSTFDTRGSGVFGLSSLERPSKTCGVRVAAIPCLFAVFLQETQVRISLTYVGPVRV